MKIVKQFDDPEYFDSQFIGPDDEPSNPLKDRWIWGLGDDGEIYFQSTENMDTATKWYALKYSRSYGPHTLKTMKQLVKEFGHLLPFM